MVSASPHHTDSQIFHLTIHQSLLSKTSVTEATLLQVLWQGSLCCSKNSQLQWCPFCPTQERTWHHMFYECPGCIKKHGEVPAVWAPCLGQLGMEHFWCRWLVPRHWTIAPPIAVEGLVVVGIFHDHNVESGATILLGTE